MLENVGGDDISNHGNNDECNDISNHDDDDANNCNLEPMPHIEEDRSRMLILTHVNELFLAAYSKFNILNCFSLDARDNLTSWSSL